MTLQKWVLLKYDTSGISDSYRRRRPDRSDHDPRATGGRAGGRGRGVHAAAHRTGHTVPVSQGDGTFSMQNVTQAIEFLDVTQAIAFLDVEAPHELPDPGSVSKPTIAYVDSEDDYVGVFKQ